jgi:hypothetical protein
MDELRRTVERLSALDARRASLGEYRDRQIVESLAAGATWAQVQEVTGLSPRGVQMAIRRARAR